MSHFLHGLWAPNLSTLERVDRQVRVREQPENGEGTEWCQVDDTLLCFLPISHN
jgi:hypothetical protein